MLVLLQSTASLRLLDYIVSRCLYVFAVFTVSLSLLSLLYFCLHIKIIIKPHQTAIFGGCLCLSYSILLYSSVFISVVKASPCAKEMIILILTYLIITQYKEIIHTATLYRQPLWHWWVNTGGMTKC